jgi:SAM-dependent methyltransferase
MKKNFSHSCRSCGHTKLFNFIDLGMSPLSNSYIKPADLNKVEYFYPLHAVVCEHCLLVQIDEFVAPHNIFTDYAYFSSYSNSWLDHCKSYVNMMIERFELDANSSVIEIASNDGYLLQYFIARGIPCLGIEPAQNVADIAIQKGVPTETEFFGEAYANNLNERRSKPNLIIGNNVLAHVPNINDFVSGLKKLLAEDGVITLEFPHLLQLIDKVQFDTIYHEHFSYLSLFSVEKILKKYGLKVFDVEEIATHGGSIRIYVSHIEASSHKLHDSVVLLREKENLALLGEAKGYVGFSNKANKIKRDLLSFLNTSKAQGKSIIGYGAAAKGNTLLNYCGIRSDYLDYVVDLSPHKQGLYLPGTHIPIYPPNEILRTKPDFVLILPWNISSEVIEQNASIRDWGGKFIVAIPELNIL